MNAGIPVVGKRYLGLTHDFAMLNPITHTPGIRAAIADVILALKNALKK